VNCVVCGVRVLDAFRCRYGSLPFCTLCFDGFNQYLVTVEPDVWAFLLESVREYKHLHGADTDDDEDSP